MAMPKALCIAGMAVSAVLLILFLWDLAAPTWMAPFKKASMMMDIAFILSSAGLAYLSWLTWKEQD
jgi:hypothetical protein